MSNKRITLEDKKTVIRRLAEGQSTRQAIEGTSIASNQTAARIAKEESHAITQIRRDYTEAIEKSVGNFEQRVKILSQMLYAEKPFRLGVVSQRCQHIPINGNENTYIFVDDWETRLKAIKYIDQVSGILPMQGGTHINVLQHVS